MSAIKLVHSGKRQMKEDLASVILRGHQNVRRHMREIIYPNLEQFRHSLVQLSRPPRERLYHPSPRRLPAALKQLGPPRLEVVILHSHFQARWRAQRPKFGAYRGVGCHGSCRKLGNTRRTHIIMLLYGRAFEQLQLSGRRLLQHFHLLQQGSSVRRMDASARLFPSVF